MKNLNLDLLKSGFSLPSDLKYNRYQELPERVLQFGEGNFLRGFVDWMIDRLNQNQLFNGKIVVVQPIAQGMVDLLNRQDGLYTLFLRGLQQGKVVAEKTLISSVSRGINPYQNFSEYLQCAENPDLRVIISNTTEAGIVYDPNDRFEQTPPASFPGKLTVFLYRRFQVFQGDLSKGFIIIPCELIDRNGDNLQRIVLQLANEWHLGADFILWLNKANHFLNSLVDRIVTGYPKDEAQQLSAKLGYQDQLLNTAEIFHLWVIEGERKLAEELPFTKIGLHVLWTDDLTPYRTRKVRILNGAHTMTVLAAYLYGKDTVKDCLDDSIINTFMKKGIAEIITTLDLPINDLEDFATDVLERFANPFIKHYLLSIALNSTSKFKTRVLPSILEYIKRSGRLPQILTFSMAALLAFYRVTEVSGNSFKGTRSSNQYEINDDLQVLEVFKELWLKFDGSKESITALVAQVISQTEIWGINLGELEGFATEVTDYLYDIVTYGMMEALKKIV